MEQEDRIREPENIVYNSEYLFKTVEQMEKLSIQDADLQWLAQDVRARLAEKGLGASPGVSHG